MKVQWIGGERDLPGVGRMRTGAVVDMADDMARDLVRQGLAKKYKESRRDPGLKNSGTGADPTE